MTFSQLLQVSSGVQTITIKLLIIASVGYTRCHTQTTIFVVKLLEAFTFVAVMFFSDPYLQRFESRRPYL